MARFKVIYSYGKSPMSSTVMGQTHTYNNVVYHWKDNEELEFPDEKQAMDFYNKIIDSWEKEEIYYKDRDSKKIHYNSVVVKAFKNGMWVPIKSANYKDWYDANKERKQKEYMEKNKQQPAGIVDNVMENKKNMKKQIKLKENELKKIVENKVRGMLKEMFENSVNEEIDTGQVPSVQDISDMRSSRNTMETNPEAQKLYQRIQNIRKNFDEIDKFGEDVSQAVEQKLHELVAQYRQLTGK